MRLFTYVTTPGGKGKTHVITGTSFSYTMCGRSSEGMYRSTQSLTGSDATCSACRRHTPAGKAERKPSAVELRAQYKQSLLLQLAEMLDKNVGVTDGSGFDLTAEQAASVRHALAEVLENRARTGRMSK